MWMSCNEEVIWGMDDYFSKKSIILNSFIKFTKYLENNSSSIFCVLVLCTVSHPPLWDFL